MFLLYYQLMMCMKQWISFKMFGKIVDQDIILYFLEIKVF